MPLLDELNAQQREAVTAIDGPVLVLAGAGTGKTRVITYRVAHLIAQGVPGQNILAVTFTNKAAEQMRRRIAELVLANGRDASGIWISTFHSFCARLLRREAPNAGLPRSFAIYDDDDQTRAIKLCLQNLKILEKDLAPRALRDRISSAKNHAISPDEMEAEAFDPFTKRAAAVYREYQLLLRKSAALDFDDLLLRGVALLRESSDVRTRWSAQLRFIQVDEFQDTNASQEELVRLLAGRARNVCVVGDEDQSIYSWRGAVSGNFQRFLADFPGAKTIRLQENYRSTQVILDAAGAVVSHNRSRMGKDLRATLGAGEPLTYYEARDASDEAEHISGRISALLRDDSTSMIAVLYRTSAQSRPFEETLRRVGIRYRVVGGFSFYQRAEIKDALAYIRLLFYPDDDVALLRVLNVPPRGIGKVTIDSLRAMARDAGLSLWQTVPLATERMRGGSALSEFRRMMLEVTAECAKKNPAEIVEIVLDRTGYLDWAEQQDRLDNSARADNLRELSNAVAEAIEQGETLEDVLDRASLVSDTDEFDQSIPVSLMTLHSAKGLEFEHVFLAGLEEGLLPHGRSMNSDNDIEEERRLCYVGMTRAKRTLCLSRAVYRRSWANTDLSAATPSRFLAEVPADLVEAAPGSISTPGEKRRYEPDPEYYQPQFNRGKRAAARQTNSYDSPASNGASNRLIGQRVKHPSYGVGTILKIEDDGDDRRFIVSFRDHGTKKLIERYAHLQFV